MLGITSKLSELGRDSSINVLTLQNLLNSELSVKDRPEGLKLVLEWLNNNNYSHIAKELADAERVTQAPVSKSLREACEKGRIEEVKEFLDNNANPSDNNCLAVACENGHLEIAKVLIAHLTPKEVNAENTNCLKIALGNRKKGKEYHELFAFLAQHPKVNAGVSDSYLLRDMYNLKDLEAFTLLAKNPNSHLAIFKADLARKAAEEGKNDYLCAVLKNYRSLNTSDAHTGGNICPSDHNNTAVKYALQQGNIKAVRMLIFAGVFINYPPTDQWLVNDYVNNLIKTGRLSDEEFIDSKDKLVNLLNNPEQLGKLTKDELDILNNTARNLGINLDEKSCIAAITAIRSQSKTDNNNNNQDLDLPLR